jgi:hypothetical protein
VDVDDLVDCRVDVAADRLIEVDHTDREQLPRDDELRPRSKK